jgi:hypothetical protein
MGSGRVGIRWMAVAAESKWRRADHKQQMDDDGADRDEGVARAVACVPTDSARRARDCGGGPQTGVCGRGVDKPQLRILG